MTETTRAHARAGWREDEVELLFEVVRATTDEGRPLREAFEDVAGRLGRKPNSIRNFYYAKTREMPDAQTRKASFTMFTEEELDELLRTVLLARGAGESVRACVTRMACGDRQRMLRYQNKYRSILKNKPERLRDVAQRLRQEGYDCPDVPLRAAMGDASTQKLFQSALSLSRELEDNTLSQMLTGLDGLLRRVAERAQVVDITNGLTDAETLTARWREAQREADRLRVEVDLLKLRLEDLEGAEMDEADEGDEEKEKDAPREPLAPLRC